MIKPYFETDAGIIYQGHVLEVLSGMEAESVHCVVTSPPYWGLRDYGLPPMIWGGDGACKHEWGDESIKKYVPKRDHDGANGFSETRGTEPARAGFKTELKQGQFCQRCNAWRGSFGLEPTPDCGRPFMELRDDLTKKEREYVMDELKKEGLI